MVKGNDSVLYALSGLHYCLVYFLCIGLMNIKSILVSQRQFEDTNRPMYESHWSMLAKETQHGPFRHSARHTIFATNRQTHHVGYHPFIK